MGPMLELASGARDDTLGGCKEKLRNLQLEGNPVSLTK